MARLKEISDDRVFLDYLIESERSLQILTNILEDATKTEKDKGTAKAMKDNIKKNRRTLEVLRRQIVIYKIKVNGK